MIKTIDNAPPQLRTRLSRRVDLIGDTFCNPHFEFFKRVHGRTQSLKPRGILASAFNGKQLQDTYRVRGRSVLLIVTADGNFDYEIPIDVEVNEVPF